MRLPTIVVAVLLTVASLAGCGLFQSEEDERIGRLLNESAEITVFVRNDVTVQQKTDIEPAYLPESFVVTMKDQAAVRNVRDSAIHSELNALPGVSDLVIRCATVDECKENISR